MDENEDDMLNSDSDDELLAPDFLKKVEVPNIQFTSPRRAVKPTDGFTLSPLPNLGNGKKGERSCKAKISMHSLLNEKKKIDVIQKNTSEISDLRAKFHKDDYMDLVTNELDFSQDISQISNMSNDYEDSQDPSQSQSQSLSQPNVQIKEKCLKAVKEENKENLRTLPKRFINDFPDTFPGEKFFTQYRDAIDLRPALTALYCDLMDCDKLDAEKDFLGEDENDLLCTIVDTYTPHIHKLNLITCKSLWEILCYCQSSKVIKTAYQHLTNYLLLNVKGDHDNDNWAPSVDNFIEALKKCGADFNIMIPDLVSNEIGKYTSHIKVDVIPSPLSPKSIRRCFFSRLNNFQCIIKLMTTSVQNYSEKYTIIELTYLLIAAIRLTIERVVQSVLHEVTTLVASILDTYESTEWLSIMEKVWNILLLFEMHHRNLLQIVSVIPQSKRGIEFREMLAFNVANSLVKTSGKFTPSPIKIVKVYDLVALIEIDDETDYFKLYSVINLLGMCIKGDDVKARQRTNMMKLCDRLQLLHGDIKECKGAFLDRAKVKDVLLRMVSKFKFLAKNTQIQPKLECYFGSQSSQSSVIPIKTIFTSSQVSSSGESQDYKSSQSQDLEKEGKAKQKMENDGNSQDLFKVEDKENELDMDIDSIDKDVIDVMKDIKGGIMDE